eukprot:PhM_4_TR17960/c0_g1_i1/m.76679
MSTTTSISLPPSDSAAPPDHSPPMSPTPQHDTAVLQSPDGTLYVRRDVDLGPDYYTLYGTLSLQYTWKRLYGDEEKQQVKKNGFQNVLTRQIVPTSSPPDVSRAHRLTPYAPELFSLVSGAFLDADSDEIERLVCKHHQTHDLASLNTLLLARRHSTSTTSTVDPSWFYPPQPESLHLIANATGATLSRICEMNALERLRFVEETATTAPTTTTTITTHETSLLRAYERYFSLVVAADKQQKQQQQQQQQPSASYSTHRKSLSTMRLEELTNQVELMNKCIQLYKDENARLHDRLTAVQKRETALLKERHAFLHAITFDPDQQDVHALQQQIEELTNENWALRREAIRLMSVRSASQEPHRGQSILSQTSTSILSAGTSTSMSPARHAFSAHTFSPSPLKRGLVKKKL